VWVEEREAERMVSFLFSSVTRRDGYPYFSSNEWPVLDQFRRSGNPSKKIVGGGILAHEPPEFHSNTCMDTRVTILFSLSLSLSFPPSHSASYSGGAATGECTS